MAKKKAKSKSKKQLNFQKGSTKNVPNDLLVSAVSVMPVMAKVCRLCETKDGPFLNIFESDKSTAKKIDELMPFGISENDELPHKICFRCSAKVEELHEFVQKCVKTQENLLAATGKKDLLNTKTKTREQWEEKLNKTNLSNDDICDALIRKAMEAIKDMPLNQSVVAEDKNSLLGRKVRAEPQTNNILKLQAKTEDSNAAVNLKPVKLTIEKCDQRVTRSGSDKIVNKQSKKLDTINTNSISTPEVQDSQKPENSGKKDTTAENIASEETTKEEMPFNIMDHVSTIKVNQVGVLFQCKLCNRNFLKKEIVESHFCARNGAPKTDITKHLPPPEPPKATNTVKYFKMDSEKRIMSNGNDSVTSNKECKEVPAERELNKALEEPVKPLAKPKPKIGPASKVKKTQMEPSPCVTETPEVTILTPTAPLGNFKLMPNVNSSYNLMPSPNSRYKIMPGPNNSFVLVEEGSTSKAASEETNTAQKVPKKRKNEGKIHADMNECSSYNIQSSEVIDVDEPTPVLPSQQKPYPVGLFQTVAHHTGIYVSKTTQSATFTTPAMKKQSYTVHQTDNPSKLVISTKPQISTEEIPKKKSKRIRPETNETPSKEPFSVTLEDAAPPKDPGFFTFINVDPLLQPSYVLPTDNIIQESQISTSTPVVKAGGTDKKEKEQYSCNMCNEKFSREKKLLTHIQSHYDKLDEEDMKREERSSNKRKQKK